MRSRLAYMALGIFLITVLSVPAISAQLEAEAPLIYMNAGQCAFFEVALENTGNQDIFFVNLPDDANVPNCCSLTTSKTIETLETASQDSIPVRLCSTPSSIKGEHVYDLAISSTTENGVVPLHIFITKNFTEVLSDDIDKLDSAILSFADDLTIDQFTPYLAAQQSAFEARILLERGSTERAQISIENAEGALELIEANSGGIQVTRFFVAAVVIFIIIVGIVYNLHRRTLPYDPSKGLNQKTSKPDKNSLLKNLDMLEVKLSLLDRDRFSKKETEYYDKTHESLKKVRQFVEENMIEEARKAFSYAEINLKVLEHRLVSLRLLETSRELRNGV